MFKLIEINPRLWVQNSLPSRCRINFLYIAYMDAIGKPIDKPALQKEGIKWLCLSVDIISSLKSLINKYLSLNEWLLSYKGEKEYSFFSWDDPLPYIISIVNLILFQFPFFIKRRFFNSINSYDVNNNITK